MQVMNENLLKIVEQSGILLDKSPLFVYDQSAIAKNIENVFLFLDQLGLKKKTSRFYFSYKSCPNPTIAKEILKKFYGVDVSSYGEYLQVKKMGILPKNISVSGPAKTKKFLEALIEDNVSTIHFDSLDEIDAYTELLQIKKHKTTTQFTCRLNVDRTSSKLGMSFDDAKKAISEKKILVSGIHVYLGREQFSVELVSNLLKEIGLLLIDAPEIADVFLGPGMNLSHLTEKVSALSGLQSLNWHFEMGRVIVDSAGLYFSEILTVKNATEDQVELIINGGIQHYLSAFTDIRKMDHYKAAILDEEGRLLKGEKEAKIYGSLCLPNDLFAWVDNCPKEVRRGYWACFYPCGAYNISASLNEFIAQDKARICLINETGKLSAI